MKGFPHLVEMHKKHADKGLVVVTISLDPPKDAKMVAAANRFLRDTNAPFKNLLLDEAEDFVSKKLDFAFPPCYYVFDRRGKWVRFLGVDYDEKGPYAAMEKVVVEMLNDQ